jgi:AI-2 transport protein TqsA
MPDGQPPQQTAEQAGPKVPEPDWRDLFYVHAFLSLAISDSHVERRELVWVKRFVEHTRDQTLRRRLDELLATGRSDLAVLERLGIRAAAELTTGEKRRFVYNLAQLCKSKGEINDIEYESILALAARVGVADTEADAIIHSVYSVNDSFMAIMGLLALGVILYAMRVVFVPLVVAIFLTMIVSRVERLVARLLPSRRLGWLHKLAALVVIIAALGGVVMAAVTSGRDIGERWPHYETKMKTALEGSEAARRTLTWLAEHEAVEQLKQLPIGRTVGQFVGSVLNLLANALLIVIFTGFLVFSSGSFTGILQEMNDKISAYISIKTLMSLLSGVGVYVLCLFFGVDFALFWATIGFLLNFIPSVGSIVASAPPILLAMVQLDTWAGVALFATVLFVMQLALGQVLEPKLMGQRLAVKPLAILLGLIFWGFLWGIPGMFLAAPLMALLRILASYFNFSRSFERLLAA